MPGFGATALTVALLWGLRGGPPGGWGPFVPCPFAGVKIAPLSGLW